MDTNERLQKLMNQRGWSMYQLAKLSALSESTVMNIFRRNTVPSISTLEKMCKAFGITLAQFFSEDGDPLVSLSPEQRILFDAWLGLNQEQRDVLMRMTMIMQKGN